MSISDPQSPWRRMTDELKSSSEAWRMLLSTTSLVYSMLPRPIVECHAAADTMATDAVVGIGGYIIFPSSISGWCQLQLDPSDFQDIAPRAKVPLQRNICAFELLGQCLLQLSARLLKGCRQHCTVITACDNTSGEVAATKGISSRIAISNILPHFFRYQLLHDIFQQVLYYSPLSKYHSRCFKLFWRSWPSIRPSDMCGLAIICQSSDILHHAFRG